MINGLINKSVWDGEAEEHSSLKRVVRFMIRNEISDFGTTIFSQNKATIPRWAAVGLSELHACIIISLNIPTNQIAEL